MTIRAVILGFLGAIFVASFTYFNDAVMRQTMFVGNHMPISVYGGLIIFLLVINPLLYYIGKRFAMSGKELAVALALTLAACVIPGSGLLRTFTASLMMPHHYNRTEPGWKDNNVIGMVPARMLAGVQPPYEDDDVLDARAVARGLTSAEGVERSKQMAAIASLVDDESKAEMKSALAESMARPDASSSEKALAAFDRAVSRREARLDATAGAVGGDASVVLTPAEIALAKTLIESAMAAPSDETPGAYESVRALNLRMLELGFDKGERRDVTDLVGGALLSVEASCRGAVADALNGLLGRTDVYDGELFRNVDVPLAAAAAAGDAEVDLAVVVAGLSGAELARLNRETIDSAFPTALRGIIAKDNTAVSGFIQGLSVGDESISLGDIPWGAWTRTLWFWLPLILTLWVGIVALAVIVHRQWADHEQLPYPIAAFADALLPGENEAKGSVFRNKLFLIGGGAVMLIHVNNYLCNWFPNLIAIPTVFDFGSLRSIFPNIDRGGGWFFFWPRLYVTPLAFAYFLTTPVSFSLGIGATVFAWISGVLAGYGLSMGGGSHYFPNYNKLLTAGAYIGMLLTTLYTGRHYYRATLRHSLFLKCTEKIAPSTIWAGRIFLVALVAVTAQLTFVGLDWQIALFYTVVTLGIFLVMARICAETGVFFIQPGWAPGVLLFGLVGGKALGPSTLAVLYMVSTVLLIDPREALMPYLVNGLKILDLKKVKVGKPAVLFGAVLFVGIAFALPVTLYFQYNQASHMADGWATVVPKFTFSEASRTKIRLEAQGSLEESESTHGFARLLNVSVDWGNILSFVIGMTLVIGFALARWRIPWWPIHPVMFIVWSWYAGYMLAFSLLIGCLIKFIVMKYGGEPVFQKVKPLMFGLIAGDMLGGIVPSIIGFIYYLITDELPKSFAIMPT